MKAIALLSQIEGFPEYKQRLDALADEAKAIFDKVMTRKKEMWDEFEVSLKKQGLLPAEYDRKKWILEIDEKRGVLMGGGGKRRAIGAFFETRRNPRRIDVKRKKPPNHSGVAPP